VRRCANALALASAASVALVGAGGGGGAILAKPTPPRGTELATLAQPPVPSALASQRIYFVLPDRYANGDPTNDTGGVGGSRSATGFDPADTGYFHGGDYRGLTGDCTGARGLARIKNLGFTSIWVTPPFRQKFVQGDSAAYHGYWALGLDQVDPHLGTEADFAAFVACAHSLGLKVILDVVVNHTADVIQLASYAYGAPKPPIVPPAEANVKSPAWLNDTSNYHNRGNIDFGSCPPACLELGDFFGLDDLATEKAAVRDGLADVFAGWIRRYRLDGFRIDTARHVERTFFPVWVPRILAAAREAGVPDFQIFGEAFVTNAVELSSYVRDRGLPNVLDFPFQDAAVRFAGGGAGARGLADRLNDDDYFRTAANVAPTPPTFLGNHDIGRAALKIREGGAGEGGALLQRVLLGYDLLYLLRGAPVVYYGDEVGMIGRGGDKAARQDMFPTAVEEWRSEERVASGPIGRGSSFDVTSPIASRLVTLGALRRDNPVLSTGATIVRHADRNVLVVSRIDASGRREYLAVLNAGTGTARVTVATATPQAEWTHLLGETAPAASSANGSLTITVAPLSSAVLRAERQIAVSRPRAPKLTAGRDSLSDLMRLRATVAGRAPVTVAFAVRRGAGRWTRIATDDSPPYRAFLDPTRYRRRERIQLVAIARALNSTTAVSRVLPFTVRR